MVDRPERISVSRRVAPLTSGNRAGCGSRRNSSGGFTFVELLIVLGLIALLAGMTLYVVSRARASAQRVTCLSNLRQIGIALHSYAMDFERFPNPLVDNICWEQSLATYAPDPRLFCCPSDKELFPSFGSSYDWRDTGDTATTLAGRAVMDVRRTDAVMAFESLPGWHAKKQMNVVRFSGAAEALDQQAGLGDLKVPIR